MNIFDGFNLKDIHPVLKLARVGQMHNNLDMGPLTSADSNTMLWFFSNMDQMNAAAPAVFEELQAGRNIFIAAPTNMQGKPHFGTDYTIQHRHTVESIQIDGSAPSNGRQLVVITYGPDAHNLIPFLGY